MREHSHDDEEEDDEWKAENSPETTSSTLTQKTFPIPDFWNEDGPDGMFCKQMQFHVGFEMVKFSIMKHPLFARLPMFNGPAKNINEFYTEFTKLSKKFIDVIDDIFAETPLMSLSIEHHDKYKARMVALAVSFVPNLSRLRELQDCELCILTKNNEGQTQCTFYLDVKIESPIYYSFGEYNEMYEDDYSGDDSEGDDEDTKKETMLLRRERKHEQMAMEYNTMGRAWASWILSVCGEKNYNIFDEVCAITSPDTPPYIIMRQLLQGVLKKESRFYQATGEFMFIDCSAHLVADITQSVYSHLRTLDRPWIDRISKLSEVGYEGSSLDRPWERYFGFRIPSADREKWFSEFWLFHAFLRSVPELPDFVHINRKEFVPSDDRMRRTEVFDATAFDYSKEEIDEIVSLLYFVAPLNTMLCQLQDGNENSALFGSYYGKVLLGYLDDIQEMATSGKLCGAMGEALKSYERFQNTIDLSESQIEICSLFSNSREHLAKLVASQQNNISYPIMDALNPFSKLEMTKKNQTPEQYELTIGKLQSFFTKYLAMSPTSANDDNPWTEDVSTNATVDTNVASGVNDNIQNEYERYLADQNVMELPENLEETSKAYYQFWIENRHTYPKLCELALTLLYAKGSIVDAETMLWAFRMLVTWDDPTDRRMMLASVMIRGAMETFRIVPKVNPREVFDGNMFDCVAEVATDPF